MVFLSSLGNSKNTREVAVKVDHEGRSLLVRGENDFFDQRAQDVVRLSPHIRICDCVSQVGHLLLIVLRHRGVENQRHFLAIREEAFDFDAPLIDPAHLVFELV